MVETKEAMGAKMSDLVTKLGQNGRKRGISGPAPEPSLQHGRRFTVRNSTRRTTVLDNQDPALSTEGSARAASAGTDISPSSSVSGSAVDDGEGLAAFSPSENVGLAQVNDMGGFPEAPAKLLLAWIS